MLERLRDDKAGPWIVLGGVVLAATFLTVVAVGLSSVYQSVYHDYTSSQHEAARKDHFKQRCAKLTSVVELRRCFENEIETGWGTQRAQEDLYAQKQMADWAFWMVVLTALIGIPSLGLTGFGVVLVYLNLREARSVTIAALQSKKAAVEANKIAREGSERQLRAYITVDTSNIEDIGNYWTISIMWKNTGQTPAVKVRTHTNWLTFTNPIPDDFDFPKDEAAIRNDASVVGAGQEFPSWPIFIPNVDIQRVHRNIQTLYVWGAANYSDMFADTPRRRTEFCYLVTVDRTLDGKVAIGMRIYGPHNGVDEGCYYPAEPT